METANTETQAPLDAAQAAAALESLRMRLLDLTARNRLINFRHTKSSSLRIIDELPDQLAEMLLAETEMRFRAVPEPDEKALLAAGYLELDPETRQPVRLRDAPGAEEWARHLELTTDYEVPQGLVGEQARRHSDSAIQTLLYPHEMEARLKKLLQASDSAIQEMGANILYLAFGFLEWYESGNPRLAPLFLMPVRLHKGRLNSRTRIYEYTLSYSGEDIIPNLSLREKLRVDFSMALPDLDEETQPEGYLDEVRELIGKLQPKWRVRRYISLALLNFSKLLMYLDLDPERWPEEANIVNHPVVSRFLTGYRQESEPGASDLGFGDEYPIDEMVGVHADYPLIDDADSSQHSALIDAVDGKDLVIEGPPGTGKSQTITNLIAAALARGRRVLFVAEKLAALEVVRTRLDAVGLGDFCLELHSHKSQKRKVLSDVGDRLRKHGRYRRPQDIELEIARYEELKTLLKDHAEKINRPWKQTGRTLHQIFMKATRYRNLSGIDPAAFHPENCDGDCYDPATQRRNADQVAAYRSVYRAVLEQLNGGAGLQEHPWHGVGNGELQMFDLERVHVALEGWQSSLERLASRVNNIAGGLNCEPEAVAQTLDQARSFLEQMESLPALQGDEALDRLPLLRGGELQEAQNYLERFEAIQAEYAALGEAGGPELVRDLEAAEQWRTGNDQLKRLIAPEVKMAWLHEAVERLGTIDEQLGQLEEPLQGVVSALGERVAGHLDTSEAGLAELGTAIGQIAALDPALWERRDPRFDNEELDQLLPRLGNELEQLRGLWEGVRDIFDLTRLPDSGEIRVLAATLADGGLLRWLKSDWRAARSKILSWAAGDHVSLDTMEPLLEELAEFVEQRRRLEDNPRYRQALGPHLKGLDTDLPALESLRSWYREVRRQYGVGFGKRAPIGDAILAVPADISRAFRSLAERGIPKRIGELLDYLAGVKEVFAPVTRGWGVNTLLTGTEGAIPRLLGEVKRALDAGGPLTGEKDLTLAELGERLDRLHRLKQQVESWSSNDCDQRLFQGRLQLRVGAGVDAGAGHATLRNTLELAGRIDSGISSQALLDHIYRQPSAETFENLTAQAWELSGALAAQEASYQEFAALVHLDVSGWTLSCGDHIQALMQRNRLALEQGEALHSWLDYVRMRDQAETQGLLRLVQGVESGELGIELVEDAYQAALFDALAREILREDPELGRFSGHSQEAIQEQFREYDNKLKRLQCEQIAWRIDQVEITRGNLGARVREHSERVLLEHELGKKTRHIPIRQLLRRAGKALAAAKPCFMMGPMSVAQYLAPGQIEFDLVVMDEASQIKPQDALGAVARGSQLVVVGDPKQLPPTSFFDRMVDADDAELWAIEESESILDATLPMFRARRLRWHYRSQHESLIAFSNHAFYGSDLVLFPSPHKRTEEYGVQYSRVPRGCFVNRRNMEEAKIISDAVREHFRRRPEETLGVVAMSSEQSQQIERAIETLAKEDLEFQRQLDQDATRSGALFVKNLENVQGDERDVIFVSMTYGPKEPGGRVYQRFGPIGSDSGWRRLNVLFTRSKKRMHIFSSMGSDDVKVGPTSHRGVKAMRDFLSYCETGVLARAEQESGAAAQGDFAAAVIEELGKEGFECIPRVGAAGFFIDVAVTDPGNPGRYLMGIECDGPTYHSAKSARDRDRLREAVLQRLGWNVRRIWSTDWYKNPQGELAPIVRALHELKTTAAPATGVVEAEEIDNIVEQVEAQEARTGHFAFEGSSLEEKLIRFDSEVVRKELPETPEHKRLLRPAMLEALLEYTPTSKVEFLETIPFYIRQATEVAEGRYLDQVFDIINASVEDATPEVATGDSPV